MKFLNDLPQYVAFTIAIMLCALLVPGCATSNGSGATESIVTSGGATPPDPEFKALIDGYYNAWSFSDEQGGAGAAVGRAAHFYADDPGAVFYELDTQYEGWAQFKAQAMPNFMAQFIRTSFVPTSDLRISRRGPMAWTTVTFRGTGVLRSTGETIHLDGRHTAVWNRRGRNWVIVHEHLSLPRAR